MNGPIGDDDILPLQSAASRDEIVEKWLRTHEKQSRLGPEGDEDVDVQCRDRLQIKGRSDRTANRVVIDHPIGLDLIDRGQDFFELHPNILRNVLSSAVISVSRASS